MRDCKNCKNHTDSGCIKWNCEYIPKNDLISRQDDYHRKNIEEYAHDMGISLEQAEKELQVQQIIRCKDCINWMVVEDRHYCGMVDRWDEDPNWFCADAERKGERNE